MCKSIWKYELVCSFCFYSRTLGCRAINAVASCPQHQSMIFCALLDKEPTAFNNLSTQSVFQSSSSCSISWNTPPENLHEPAPKLVSQDDIHRKSSVFSGFHLNLQGCTLWYPQHVESTWINQTSPDNPMIFSAARFAARIRLLRSSSWWTFSLCLARGC